MSRHVPIINSGGALVIDHLLTTSWFDALKAESFALRSSATEQIKSESIQSEISSSDPNRHYATANGGKVQTDIYQDPCLHKRLGNFCGHSVIPTGSVGTYSYYDQPGHFLGLHRDIRRCDLTLITCLMQRHQGKSSGALRIYIKNSKLPLSVINDQTKFREIQMQAGQSVLLLGGCIPHEVMACNEDFKRHISVLCFEII